VETKEDKPSTAAEDVKEAEAPENADDAAVAAAEVEQAAAAST
jgi:hypothetical protein